MIYNVIWNKTKKEVARIETDGLFDLKTNFEKIFPTEEFTFIPMNYGKAVMLCEHGN